MYIWLLTLWRTTQLKTSEKICNIFRGMLIRCKNSHPIFMYLLATHLVSQEEEFQIDTHEEFKIIDFYIVKLCHRHYQNWDRLSSTSHPALFWYGILPQALPYMEQPLMKMAVWPSTISCFTDGVEIYLSDSTVCLHLCCYKEVTTRRFMRHPFVPRAKAQLLTACFGSIEGFIVVCGMGSVNCAAAFRLEDHKFQ